MMKKDMVTLIKKEEKQLWQLYQEAENSEETSELYINRCEGEWMGMHRLLMKLDLI